MARTERDPPEWVEWLCDTRRDGQFSIPSRYRRLLRRQARAIARNAMQRGDYDAAVNPSRSISQMHNAYILNY